MIVVVLTFNFDKPGTNQFTCIHSFNTPHHLKFKVIILTSFIFIIFIILILQRRKQKCRGVKQPAPVRIVGKRLSLPQSVLSHYALWDSKTRKLNQWASEGTALCCSFSLS